jgi:hypothetical protein
MPIRQALGVLGMSQGEAKYGGKQFIQQRYFIRVQQLAKGRKKEMRQEDAKGAYDALVLFHETDKSRRAHRFEAKEWRDEMQKTIQGAELFSAEYFGTSYLLTANDVPKLRKKMTKKSWNEDAARLLRIIAFPDLKHFMRVVTVFGGLSLVGVIAPEQAGSLLMINTVSAAGFINERGQEPLKKDDMGNVGEVRKTKPLQLAGTLAIVAACYIFGSYKARQAGQKAFEVLLRLWWVSFFYIFPCLFIKLHQPQYDLG